MRFGRRLLFTLITAAAFSLPALAQANAFDFFGAVLYGPHTGGELGAGVNIDINSHWAVLPEVALGRVSGGNVFTFDGALIYNFHPGGEQFTPYVLADLGTTHFAHNNFPRAAIGGGMRFPLGGGLSLAPEIRWGGFGLSRVSVSLVKSF